MATEGTTKGLLIGGAAALLLGILGSKKPQTKPLAGPPPVRKNCNCGR